MENLDKLDLFEIMKDYHKTYNLERILTGSENPHDNENNSYKGMCILENGSTLINRLVEQKRINPLDIYDKTVIATSDDWVNFLEKRKEKDGVYIYESAEKTLYRIRKIKDSKQDDITYSHLIPNDFLSYFSKSKLDERELREELGTKTQLALDLTQEFEDVKAYMIKRGKYDPFTKSGKVVMIGSRGVEKEFFINGSETDFYGVSRNYLGCPFVRNENYEKLNINSKKSKYDGIKKIGRKLINAFYSLGEDRPDYRKVHDNY